MGGGPADETNINISITITGEHIMTDETKIPPTPPVNPLLERVRIPGETHALPSGGLFYTDELDNSVKNGEVHVYPMTALDEITIRSPDKLFSGEAVNEVFKRCIPQIKDPMGLLAKDVDFLMVVLRKISYGDDFDIKYTHDCTDAKEHPYVVNMGHFVTNSKKIDPLTVTSMFSVTLENDQKIEMHPIRYRDIVNLMQSLSDDNSVEKNNSRMLDTMVDIISNVDGITDRDHIDEWIKTIPVGWAKKLSDCVERTGDWGPDFSTTIKCKDCNKDIEITAPMNPITFFI